MDYLNPMDFFAATGLPLPPSMPSPAEVRREARERSTDLLSEWDRLRRILERHEEVLRKRWMKKTKTQRTAILLGAWPNMSLHHRPDFEAFKKEGPQLKSQGTNFREAYLWPYINIEDLIRGNSLLLFLNSRGRHHPNTFPHADFEATHLGQVSGATMAPFLNGHTMMLEGETADSYGELVAWDDDDEAFDKMHTQLAHHPGEGLIILEIQQRILHFLNDCCRTILHDIDANALISDKSPVIPEPSTIKDNVAWPTLALMVAEAPYRVPARIKFSRLKSVIDAKCSEVKDHIRSLREDPGYFGDFLQDWSDHRQERVLEADGSHHPALDKPMFWDAVIGNVIIDAYRAVIAWDVLSKQLAVLTSLEQKYAAIISTKKKLPKAYTKALLSFRHTLDQVREGPIHNLKMGLAASPHFRSHFVREPQVPGSTMIRLRSKRVSDPMLWLFFQLWDDRQLFLIGFPNLMDELEKGIESDPKQKQKLSSWVARVFSELGLIARARHELDIYMPWAASFEHDMLDYQKAIEQEFTQNVAIVKDLERNFEGALFGKFGNPTGATFYYPSDKRHTQQNVESMRNAERKLDLFWETVDDYYKKKTGKSLYQVFQHLLADDSPLERTPEWIEPIKKPKKRADAELYQPLSHLQIDQPTKIALPQPKIKPKTRGEARTDVKCPEESLPEPEEEIQQTFTLNNRAFKVFRTIFHTPSTSDLPGEIAWADFLFAMAATGFAPEKLHGSIWQFTPAKLNVGQSIQFHEPHPRSKISFRNARRAGRRLNRTYGWHGGMFVLAT